MRRPHPCYRDACRRARYGEPYTRPNANRIIDVTVRSAYTALRPPKRVCFGRGDCLSEQPC